jgi:pimeloyl-ACP methyl ester carboxylesterase
MVRLIGRVAAAGAAALAAFVAVALIAGAPIPVGDQFILHPPPRPRFAVWRTRGFVPFDVSAADGTVLRGWIIPGRAGRPWILMSYGNGSDMVQMAPLAAWMARATGRTTVLWDYRGYGFSGGRPSVLATHADALRMYDEVRRRSGAAAWVYGLSFGTTVAAMLTVSRPVAGTILHAPPSDADTEFRHVRDAFLPWPLHRLVPVPTPAIRDAFDVAARMRRARTPLLVLHGEADTLIPIAQGRRVEDDAGSSRKRFVAIPNAEHSDVDYDGTAAGRAIVDFLG